MVADIGDFTALHSTFLAFLIFSTSLLGMVFDLASAFVTWLLIRKAAAAKSLKVALSHLCIDVAVAIAACCWVLFALLSSAGIADFFMDLPFPWISPWPILLDFVHLRWKGDHAATAVMGVSAAIPTVAYSALVILCIFAHITPRWFHRFVSRCIFLVTTEKTPVFARVGSVLGGAAAFAGAAARF